MAASSIVAIMQGIETRLATITGLRVNKVEPYQVNPPFAFVGVPDIPNYRETFGKGKYILRPTVTVGVSSVSDRAGQLALASYADVAGANSILLAIEADRTLGGVVDDCIVVGFNKHNGFLTLGDVAYFGGVFTLQVAASGT